MLELWPKYTLPRSFAKNRFAPSAEHLLLFDLEDLVFVVDPDEHGEERLPLGERLVAESFKHFEQLFLKKQIALWLFAVDRIHR